MTDILKIMEEQGMIRRIIWTFSLVISLTTMARSQSGPIKIEAGSAPGHMPSFAWNETTHNFGKIPQGSPVSYNFVFKNKGKSPLIISGVKGSCGCTVTEYTKQPVLPGQTGVVTAIFDAEAPGAFNKSIRVTANVEGGAETLYIKGEVIRE